MFSSFDEVDVIARALFSRSSFHVINVKHVIREEDVKRILDIILLLFEDEAEIGKTKC